MAEYLSLTKYRLALSNVAVAAAAFIYASPEAVDWAGFVLMCAGLFLIIASACVFNNWYDKDIDARMERTKNRAMPAGRISSRHALIFSMILFAFGGTLVWHAGALALLCAVAGWVIYALFYTPLKHAHSSALFVGAVAGALPPLSGYAAAAGKLDWDAAWIFIFMLLWQIPHFIAIAIYRFDEYKSADVPLLIRLSPGMKARRIARIAFYLSLVLLLLLCAVLILHRWMR